MNGHALLLSAKTGLFAGMIWGALRWLAVGLNFTEVTQAFLADPFVRRDSLGGVWWQFAGYGLFILMSVIAALIYVLVLGKLSGPWPGIGFGAVWWLGGYAGLGPLVGAVPPLKQVGWTSLTTDFCLFLVWGLFIGYTIAFSLHDEFKREPGTKPDANRSSDRSSAPGKAQPNS